MYTIQATATITGRGTVITIAPLVERIQPGGPIRFNGTTTGKVCAIEKRQHTHHTDEVHVSGCSSRHLSKSGIQLSFRSRHGGCEL